MFVKTLPFRKLLVLANTCICLALTVAPSESWSQSNDREFQASDLPSMGNPADRFMSPQQEVKLGAEFYRAINRAGAVLQDPEIGSYIQHLGNVLVNSLGSGEQDFTFFVVKDDGINAFAVPGGYIGVNAGLILASNTENQLASVIAHEIAHISQRHIARQIADMNSTQIPTLGAIFAGMLLAAAGSGEAGMAVMTTGMALQQQQYLNFTREHEIEADRIGLGILYNAGFDPTGMPQFFKTLQRQRFASEDLRQFAFLMTHPLDHVRIAEAQGHIDSLPVQKHNSSSYYQFSKARLRALASNSPTELLRSIEKNLKNQKDDVFDPDSIPLQPAPLAQAQSLLNDEQTGISQDADSLLQSEAFGHSSGLVLLKLEKNLKKQKAEEARIINQYAYSQALERTHDFKKANEVLNSMKNFDRESIPLQLARARSLINSDRTDSAIKILSQLKAIYPDDFSVNYYYATALLKNKSYQQGSKLLKQYLIKNPAPTLEVYKLMAELYDANGQGIESKIVLSDYYYNCGNLNGAVFQLREALKDPKIDSGTRGQIELKLRDLTQMSRQER